MPTPVLMPALSPTMTEGTLAKWLVKSGDKIKAGQVIAEIETDKATMEVEAVDEGVMAALLVAAGTEAVAVNRQIALLANDGEDWQEVAKLASSAPAAGQAAPVSASVTASPPTNAPTNAPTNPPTNPQHPQVSQPSQSAQVPQTVTATGGKIFISPLAKRLAKEAGLVIEALKELGSGPRGRIVKRDIEKALADGVGKAVPKSPSSGASAASHNASPTASHRSKEPTIIPLTSMRKTIAKRLVEAKQTIPHFYLTRELVLDNLLAARQQLNQLGEGRYKLSVNDFIIKASALALLRVPGANACWGENGVIQYHEADISVAVATPNGLITPIIHAAEQRGLADISATMKALADKARQGKLKPEEYQGGSFTISNLGMYGIQNFQAIINPPQACILAVGAGIEKPIARQGKLEIATVMSATLSVDHRVVDGALGAQWLEAFAGFIENPVTMLA